VRERRNGMGTEHDDVIEKVLAALGGAKAPEGLEERVAARLEQHAMTAREVKFRWRETFAGSAAAGVWWRGAVAGAAASMLAVGVVFLAGHFGRTPANGERAVRGVAAVSVAQHEDRGEPCSGTVRVAEVLPAQRGVEARDEGEARSQPAPELALTAEERSLVRAVRVSDVKELASLNPEVREKLEAEEAAQFRSFFPEPVKQTSTEPRTAEAGAAEPAVEPGATESTEPAVGPVTGENE
jgi:hypothetical protein